MRRRSNEPRLPLIEDVPSPEPEPSVAVTSGSRVGQFLVAVLLGAVGWVVLSGPADDLDDPAPTSTVPAEPETVAPDGEPAAGLGEVLDGQSIHAVVSSRAGDRHRLLTISADDVVSTDLPQLSDFVFDASSRYLAAISISRLAEPRRVLWVAEVGGQCSVVRSDGAVGVERAASSSAYTRVAWLDEAFVYAEQQGLDGEGGEPHLTIVTAADQRVELPLPSAFDGRAWINSIAVPTHG